MEQIGLLSQAQAMNLAPLHKPLKLSHLFMAVILTLNITVISVIALAQRLELHNPFAAFGNIFPGQAASGIDTELFSCSSLSNPTKSLYYCKLEPAEGTFSRIHVTIWGPAVRHTHFTPRENTLSVGDLLALWGQPELQKYSLKLYLYWPDQNVLATADGQFSPFLPVQRVQFINPDMRPLLPSNF